MHLLKLSDPREEDVERLLDWVRARGEVRKRVDMPGECAIVFECDPGFEDPPPPPFPAGRVEILEVGTPYVLAARAAREARSRVPIRGELVVGGSEFVVMAGPCAVESKERVVRIAVAVRRLGARVLRGGAFKPRTSPYSFQGLKMEGLRRLGHAGRKSGLPVVSEVLAPEMVEAVASRVDVLQVGMRNGLNYPLLEAIGRHPARPPVLLKRGIGCGLDEFLCAADYILAGGNPNVMLCLRGNTGFSKYSRATLDLADIPLLRRMTHLPIIVDPSHAAGRRDIIPSMAAAALVAGADGLLVEVHDRPEEALVDGPQALTLEAFGGLMRRLRALAPAMDREVAGEDLEGPSRGAFADLGLEAPPLRPSRFRTA